MKASDLRKSILQYAVEGKLVPQNENDEVAEVLYKKIQKEKEELIKQGKIKKDKPLPPVNTCDVPYDIPDNWKWVRLGEVCSLSIGKTPERKITEYWKNGIYNWVSISDMINGGFINKTKEKISITAFNKVFKKDLLPVGSLLFSFKLTIGKVSILNIPAYTNEAICAITPYKYDNIKQYLFKILPILNLLDNANDAIKGKTLNLQTLPLILIPLPPLAEQERIVKKVDELMALCDKLEQEEKNLKDLDKKFIERLPKSILQYAIEGKLVPQDENDEVAEILYKKIQKEKEELIKQGKIKKDKPLPPVNTCDVPYTIPNNWKWVRLGEVCEIKRGNGLTKNDFTNNGIPCIHYGQIHKYYKYYTTTTMTYTSEKVANKLKTVEYLDIIMAITSENIEDVCKSIAWLGNYSIVTGGHTAIIKHKLNPLYLVYLFNSNCFQIQKNKIAKGMKVIEVSSEQLKNILIPLPPLAEQERIVKKVDELMAICGKLEQEEKN